MLSNQDPPTTSTALLADTAYARSTRELITLVTNLRTLGSVFDDALCPCVRETLISRHLLETSAQAHVDLPRVVVIGNQSKSRREHFGGKYLRSIHSYPPSTSRRLTD